MTDEALFRVMERIESRTLESITREEALDRFVRAGIMDEEGNFKDPYKDLEWYFAARNQ